jgi:arylsulfatase A-like enzyme
MCVKDDDLADLPEMAQKMAVGKVVYEDGAKAKSIDEVLAAVPWTDHAKVVRNQQWKKAVQGYLASINFADTCLGRVLRALDEREDADEWVVMLWSDHGWHLGEKLLWRNFSLWEESTHNVLMCVAPGITKPGGRCDEPVNLLDIYPTLVDVCGLTKKDGLGGASLAAQLKEPKTEKVESTLTTHGRGNHSLRSKSWRYTRYADGGEELYDHKNDPMEWNNLADKAEYAKIKKSMKVYLPGTNADKFNLPKAQKK